LVKSIVFHLGGHKTGSTSIQQVLASRSWQSREKSVFFPKIAPASGHHNHIARTLIQKRFAKYKTERFKELSKKLNRSRANIAVLSAEHFDRVDPEVLRATLDQHLAKYIGTSRYIAYIRPHAERIVSSYAERIKQGLFLGTIDEFHEETKADGAFMQAERYFGWKTVFGTQFELRPMKRELLFRQDVVCDFFRFVFQSDNFQITGESPRNESLSLEDLAILNEMQKTLAPSVRWSRSRQESVRAIGWRLARMLAFERSTKTTKPRLHKKLLTDVVETYRQDAARLDQEFFNGTPMTDSLTDAVNHAVEQPQSIDLSHHFSPDNVRFHRAWISLMTEIYQANPKGWLEHFQENPLRTNTDANTNQD